MFRIKMKKISLIMLLGLFSFWQVQGQSSNVNDFPPLNELGTGKFMGKTGGLYPDGSNEMPPAFRQAALEMAASVQPLNAKGQADPNGKIGVVSIGASTVAMFGSALAKQMADDPNVAKELVFVNGGVGGQDLNKIADQNGRYWGEVEKRVAAAGLTNDQVQVIWFQEDDLRNTISKFPDRADMLTESFIWHIQRLKERYPNLRLLYLTGRHTTDYMPADAKDKHKEPRAYLNGWACKFVIEKQIDGDPALSWKGVNAKAPLLLWGPYFWTQGDKTRADGYSFTPDLVVNDGVHPNAKGEERVAKDMMEFWKDDPVSRIWLTGEMSDIEIAEPVWVALKLQQELLRQLDVAEMKELLQVMLLRDEVVVYNKSFSLEERTIDLSPLEEGSYTYLLTDKGNFVEKGSFEVGPDGKLLKEEEPVITQQPDESGKPSWIVNGRDKMHKLRRLLAGNASVDAIVYDMNGKEVIRIEDILNQCTDLNELLPRGMYTVKFINQSGKVLGEDGSLPEKVRIK